MPMISSKDSQSAGPASGMENRIISEYQSQERRSGKDRRAGPTSPFTRQSLAGSRQHYRRNQDARKSYFVDRYSPFWMAVLICTLVLSIADAFLTLRLLGGDIHELNPVMDFFLRLGPYHFIIIKWFLTAGGLITLLVLKNHYLWKGRLRTMAVLVILPFLYLVLVAYEISMVVSG
jgi:hypothetical protein